jgi:succinoglycan biosynthesis transport protein ExoP
MNNTPQEPPEEPPPIAGRLVPVANKGVPALRDPYRQIALGDSGMDEAGDGFSIDLREYLRIANKHKWLIIGVVAAFVALGLLRTLMQTPLYTSTVRLQIEKHGTKVVQAGEVMQAEGGWGRDFLKTQYELLKSRAVAGRAVSALKLGDDTDFLKPRGFSIVSLLRGMLQYGSSEEREATDKSSLAKSAVNIVLDNRLVKPVSGSRLVDIIYIDPSPARAQRVAMALADAYIASNIDKRFEANAYAKVFLQDQSKQLQLRLEKSERVLMDFAQREEIIAVTDKSSIAENNLASANVTLGELVSDRIKSEQLWKQIESSKAISLPQLLSNEAIIKLRGARGELTTTYQEKLEILKPNYPEMIQIKNKIDEIDRQLGVEVETIRASHRAEYETAKAQEDEMKKRVKTLRSEALDLQKRKIQYNIHKREVDTNRSLYKGLLQRYKEVEIAGGVGTNNVFVIDRAGLPRSPSSPLLLRALLLTFVLGLGAGGAAAFVLEHLDNTVTTVEEFEQVSGLVSLGVVPIVSEEGSIEEELADPRSALSEAYRSLNTALSFTTEGGLPKSLVITSAGPGEGKSITALAIAGHFATLGMKVLLIDADLRNPSLHKKLGLDHSVGLSNYLTGACTPPEAFQETSIKNLAFMATGPLPPNAADLLAGARLLSLITNGLEVFDLIVIDSPPVMGLADAPLLSSVTAATLFVVAAGQAQKGQVRDALNRLEMAHSPVIGAVLTKFDAKAAGYLYGYGAYDYTYGQATDQEDDDRQAQLTNASKSG